MRSQHATERHALALVILLAAVVGGVVLQIAWIPRRARAAVRRPPAALSAAIARPAPPSPGAAVARRVARETLDGPSAGRDGDAMAVPTEVAPDAGPGPSLETSTPVGEKRSSPAAPRPPRGRGAQDATVSQAARVPEIAGEAPRADVHDPSRRPRRTSRSPVLASTPGAAGLAEAMPPAGPAAVDEDGPGEDPGTPRPVEAAGDAPAETRLVVQAPDLGHAGQTFTVRVAVEGGSNIGHAPLRLTYDPSLIEFVSAQEGTFLSSGGGQTIFMAAPSSTPGLMYIAISRMPGHAGARGSGELCAITFLARRAGEAVIASEGSRLLDPAARAIDVTRSDTHVTIR